MHCIVACCAAFHGPSMPRADPVLVFDLDGTLLRRNSFPLWVLALLRGSPGSPLRDRMSLSWRVQCLLARRKLRRLNHDGFLHALQACWADAISESDALAGQLQTRLASQVRPNLTSVLRSVANVQVDSVLATAAAAEYAEPLGRMLGFHHVLATPAWSGVGMPCNRGPCKRDRVLALLTTCGWATRPRIFFTDHMDDLPLMRVSAAVCWFGNRRALTAAKAAAPNTRFVFCRDLHDDELKQMLAHLSQSLTTAQLAGAIAA